MEQNESTANPTKCCQGKTGVEDIPEQSTARKSVQDFEFSIIAHLKGWKLMLCSEPKLSTPGC